MALFFFNRLITSSAITGKLGPLAKISADGADRSAADQRALGIPADVREQVPRLLLPGSPGGAGGRLRPGGGRWRLARDRPGTLGRHHGTPLRCRYRDLDPHRVLAAPALLPLGAEVPGRRPRALHHPRRPPRPSQ